MAGILTTQGGMYAGVVSTWKAYPMLREAQRCNTRLGRQTNSPLTAKPGPVVIAAEIISVWTIMIPLGGRHGYNMYRQTATATIGKKADGSTQLMKPNTVTGIGSLTDKQSATQLSSWVADCET